MYEVKMIWRCTYPLFWVKCFLGFFLWVVFLGGRGMGCFRFIPSICRMQELKRNILTRFSNLLHTDINHERTFSYHDQRKFMKVHLEKLLSRLSQNNKKYEIFLEHFKFIIKDILVKLIYLSSQRLKIGIIVYPFRVFSFK